MIEKEEANIIARKIMNDTSLTMEEQMELLKELEKFLD